MCKKTKIITLFNNSSLPQTASIYENTTPYARDPAGSSRLSDVEPECAVACFQAEECTRMRYISLLIIPCIIYYVTNKETLTLS